MCLYFIGWLFYAGYQANINHGPKYLIFITVWEFIILNVYLLVSSIIVTYKYTQETIIKHRIPEPLRLIDMYDPPFLNCHCCCKKLTIPSQDHHRLISIPWYIQMNWLLYIVASQLAVPIVVFYWYLQLDIINWQVTLHEHLFILIPVLLDIFITSYPIRFYHFIYSALLGIVYSIFTIIYYASGGTHSNGSNFIYSSLDYQTSPGTALLWIAVMCTLIPFLMNSLFWGLYLLRTVLIIKKLNATEQGTLSLSTRENSVASSLGLVKSDISSSGSNLVESTVTLEITPFNNSSDECVDKATAHSDGF